MIESVSQSHAPGSSSGASGLEPATSGDGRSPFVHKYITGRHKYLFDVNTSRILRVPPAVWDIIEDVGVLSMADLASKYAAIHPSSAISEAHDAVLAMQAKGLLSPSRPREIVMPYGQEYIRQKPASRRTSVTLVATEQCNFRCSYCVYGGTYAHQRSHSTRSMSWEIAKKAIDEFLEHSSLADGRSIHFYGGEPLLNLPLLRRAVEYLYHERRQEDVEVVLTTNGSLLLGEAADFVAQHQIRANVSLDGPEHVHDRCRRLHDGTGSWRRVIDNLRMFLGKYPAYRENRRLGFHAVVVPPTDLRVLQDFFGSCDLFGQGMNFSLSFVSPVDTTFMECVAPADRYVQGYDELYAQFLCNMRNGTLCRNRNQPAMWVQTGLFQKDVLGFYKRGYASQEFPRIPERFCSVPMCVPGVRRLFVTTDGSYYPCERVQETSDFTIGNVCDGVSTKRVHEILQGHVELCREECCSCWCLPICMAGCVVAAMKDGKPDAAARRKACMHYREAAHRTMADVSEALEINPQALEYMDSITVS